MNYICTPFIASKFHRDYNITVMSVTKYDNLGHYQFVVDNVSEDAKLYMNRIKAYPLFFSILHSEHYITNERQSSIRDQITEYLYTKLCIRITNYETVDLEEGILFYPLNNGKYIMMSESEQSKIKIAIDDMSGSDICFSTVRFPICDLSDITYINDIANDMNDQLLLFEPTKAMEGYLSYNDLFTFILSKGEIQKRKDILRDRVLDSMLHGRIGLKNDDWIEASVRELGLVFGYQVSKVDNSLIVTYNNIDSRIDINTVEVKEVPISRTTAPMNAKETILSTQFNTVSVSNPFIDISPSEFSWFISRSIKNIASGMFPSIRLEGNWMFGIDIQTRRTMRNRLLTVTNNAYTNPLLKSGIKVLPDLSIILPVVSLVDIEQIVKYITDNYNRDDLVLNDNTQNIDYSKIRDIPLKKIDDTWYVTINDKNYPILADDINEADVRSNWNNGKYITPWGYYLYSNMNYVSEFIV